MNTRLIIALTLSLLLVVLYQFLFIKQSPKEIPQTKEMAAADKEGEKAQQEKELPRVVTGQRQLAERVDYRDVVVDTPLYNATFTTYGGRLKSWKLKQYSDKVPMHPLGKFVQNLEYLVKGALGFKGKKVEDTPPRPVEIVNTVAMGDLPLGISFKKGGIGYDEGIPFVPSAGGLSLTHQGGARTLTFRWRSPRGGQIDKRFTLYPDTYRMDMEIVISTPANRGSIQDTLGLEWAAALPQTDKKYGFFGPIYYTDGGFKQIKPKKIGGAETVVQGIDWFGMEEDYFLALIYPSTKGTSLEIKRTPENVINSTQLNPLALSPGANGRVSYTFFLGPKVSHLLSQITPTATKAARYGWLHVLAVPIVWLLHFSNTFTGNYGLDIIILAIFLKVVFTPLTHKSQEQMKEMQKLQPEVKRLQQKYKDDKQALNREVMELYKRRKVNPLGGCLPLLLQMPVFFALYQAFLGAIELRHAPFILWIRDLADKDPTYITPLLMGATMFVQQKMTTVSADPTQMKMMSLMPIFFTFIFLNFPSGLVLYWLVTNILSIGHQYYINKKK
ncbi:MAG TPA: membrane protein insertase YidC [Thermodesulfobacteriota bacterium]